jgi:hypothetical protein
LKAKEWVEEGEKNTKFFLGLEKARQTRKNITALKDIIFFVGYLFTYFDCDISNLSLKNIPKCSWVCLLYYKFFLVF